MAQHSFNEIIHNGEWLAHRYDAEADAFHLRHLARKQHDRVPFLTDECLDADRDPIVVGRNDAIAAVTQHHNLHFIFHSAFCASTMMAAGFNLPGIAMGLKEPLLLNDIVGWRRRGAPPAAVAERLDHAMRMLARPFGTGEAVVVKPSNVFNALMPAALTIRPSSRAILLYAPLPVFLLSVARKGLWCRLWARELLEGLLTDGIVDLGFDPSDFFRQSDLQIAAVGWLAQQRLFNRVARQFGSGRIATLDSEQLTADPAVAVKAASLHFGLEVADGLIEGHIAFGTHSKFGGRFAKEDRQAEYEVARKAYGDEIEKVVVWAQAVAKTAAVELTLPSPVLIN